MKGISPIYEAMKKIIELFDLNDKVSLYSYRDDFEKLWGLKDEFLPEKEKVCCVIDDHTLPLNWLPLGIWGCYYRAKNEFNAAKLIIIGNKESLDPPRSDERPYIPSFYRDQGIEKIDILSGSFIVDFCEKIKTLTTLIELETTCDETIKPDEIKAFQGLIYSTLSSQGSHHAVSNEIAPMILRDAILKLQVSEDKKRFIEEFEKQLGNDKERKALIKLWEWASGFTFRTEERKKDKIDIDKYLMTDIWEKWSNAKFLLVDDQAKTHGYEEIIRCALQLMIGENIRLEAKPFLPLSDAECVVNNYDGLFLDLRLTSDCSRETDYGKLHSIKLAKEISKLEISFPIIIFSSSQKREIDQILSPHKNIILNFRKPGIAGSSRSVDGNRALNNLFLAVSKAPGMIENREVYKELMSAELDKIQLRYNDLDGSVKKTKVVNFPKKERKELFRQVFLEKRYDKAFTFPYSFFEEGLYTNQLDIISQIGIISNSPQKIHVDKGTLVEKIDVNKESGRFPNTDIRLIDETYPPELADLDIEELTPGLSLNMRTLCQLRNLASHGLHKFDGMRREAIATLMIFSHILRGNIISSNDVAYPDLGSTPLQIANSRILFPLIMKSPDTSTTGKYIKDVFSSVCYYGGKNPYYDRLYAFISHSENKQREDEPFET